MKQTAVEWLIDILVTENEVILKGENFKLFEQAKEMEKNIAQEYAEFCVLCDREKFPLLDFKSYIDQIYNETYKNTDK